MSTYVISDIHGQLKTFEKMLKTIDFKNDDELYIIGDVIDRGEDGIKLLRKIMKMPNVKLFIGNHELLMLDAIKNEEEQILKDRHDSDDVDLWLDPCNGGQSTYNDFKKLSKKQRTEIVDFLKSSLVMKVLKIGKKTYHLSHAYTLFDKSEKEYYFEDLNHNEIWNVVWQNIFEADFLDGNEKKIFPKKTYTYIFGHTFTQRLDCVDEEGRGAVYNRKDFFGYKIINIDCGMALKNKSSRLACIRLEDEEIFYVPLT